MAIVNVGGYALAVATVLASVIGAIYYLRVIKLIYFDDPAGTAAQRPYRTSFSPEMKFIVFALTAFNVFYLVFPNYVIDMAVAATGSLMN